MFRLPFNSLATARATQMAARSFAGNYSKHWLSTSSGGLYDKVAFIGTGKMAQAMLYPLIKNGYQPADKVAIYDVSTSAMKSVKTEFPEVQITQSIEEVVADADLVVCAVKPQNINTEFWAQFPEKIREDATFVSILAGKPIKDFLPSRFPKIVRSMPNTPATIGQGMTVWSCTPNLTSDERDQINEVLSTFGKAVSRICHSFPCLLSFDNDSIHALTFCLLSMNIRFTLTTRNLLI
jgi:pyrroline-5-carboxylate reductase